MLLIIGTLGVVSLMYRSEDSKDEVAHCPLHIPPLGRQGAFYCYNSSPVANSEIGEGVFGFLNVTVPQVEMCDLQGIFARHQQNRMEAPFKYLSPAPNATGAGGVFHYGTSRRPGPET